MNEDTLIAAAQERAVKAGLPYTGELNPLEARQYLDLGVNAVIVDVRTKAELAYVGRIPNSIEIEWLQYPDMHVNDKFIQELEAAVDNKEQPILFICRSGVRSHNSALEATEHGFAKVFNVIEGFEGDPDAKNQRNTVNGWRFHGLPWYQS